MSFFTRPRLLVAIVNYKSAELVCHSLKSLVSQLDNRVDHVCVVDNNSEDDSVEIITRFIVENELENLVELIASQKNGGFSYGNNLAIRPVLSDSSQTPQYVLLLNPDTLVGENAVDELINFMRNYPQAGIAGSRLEDPDGTPQCSSFRFHTLFSELESSLRFGPVSRLLSRWKIASEIANTAILTDWVAGASMLIRSDVFNDIGLMDEDYFLYFEETDFCLQARCKGWDCWYVPNSRVTHFVGQSTGIISGNEDRPRRPSYWFKARQHYFLKNHGVFYTILADLIWGLGFSVWRIRRIIQRKPDMDPKNMLADFWRNSVFSKLINGRYKS